MNANRPNPASGTGKAAEARAAFDPVFRSRVGTHCGLCGGPRAVARRVCPVRHARRDRGWGGPRGSSAGPTHRNDVPRQLHAGVESARRDAGRGQAGGAGIAGCRGPQETGRASEGRFGLTSAGVVSPDGAAILTPPRLKSNRDSAYFTQASRREERMRALQKKRRATANGASVLGQRSNSSMIGTALTATSTNASTMRRVISPSSDTSHSRFKSRTSAFVRIPR